MQVHLIDGTFELFRAYFAAPSLTSPEGQEVGAARIFTRSLWKFLQRADVTHVAIAFDTVIESFRNKLFEGYKTGDGIEPELKLQFPLVEKSARALGLTVWSMRKFEADDALAAGAAKYGKVKSVKRVVLCTPDKDLYQMVNGNKIVVYDRIREITWDEKGVKKKLGIEPVSVPDYLGLVGDTADGIPGVPRWGAKSASTILAKFKRIESIPEDYKKWGLKIRGGETLSKVLNEHRKEASLYKKLATLRVDVPLKESFSDLKWKGADKKKLKTFCALIGDTRFFESVNG